MGHRFIYLLFFAALGVGISAYFPQTQENINPVKFISDKSGYTAADQRNDTKVQQFNTLLEKDLHQFHAQIDQRAQQQKDYEDRLLIQQKNSDIQKSSNEGAVAQKDMFNDLFQRTQTIIEKEFKNDQDQQRINQQQSRDQAQQILDQQEQQRSYQAQAEYQFQLMRDQQLQHDR